MENIGLQDSLLSRFDLLFIMLDQMDPEQDREISDHVLRMHRYRTPGEQDGDGEAIWRVRKGKEPERMPLSQAPPRGPWVLQFLGWNWRCPCLSGACFLFSGGYPKVCLLSVSGSGNSFEHLLWARWCYPPYWWASPVCFLLGPCFMSLVSLPLLCYRRSNFPWVKLFFTLLSLNLGFFFF